MGIKYKIAFLFTLFATLLITLVSISVYYFSFNKRENTFRQNLENRASGTARIYQAFKGDKNSLLQKLDSAGLASLQQKSISILDNDGKYIYQYNDAFSDTLLLSAADLKVAIKNGTHFFTYDKRTAVVMYQTNEKSKFFIAVAAADHDGKLFLKDLRNILWTAVVFAALLSFLTGLFFAKKLIEPIRNITGEVNLITSHNLSQRIRIHHANDELKKLSLTFNNLLDHLQDSFAIQRRFISNASHELSTPLTAVSSQLEVALQRERTPQEYREIMQSIYEDIRELQQLTRSLLDIAKTGTQGSIDLAEVRLDEVLFKVVSDVQKQNRSYRTELDFETFPEDEKLLTTFGNANLLYIAFKNIVENGCKYADNHVSRILVSFTEKEIIVHVSNRGDIITEADIENIFQPFFRTDSAQFKPGFGLGLTLTRRILSLHKGAISVESNLDKGTIFIIRLSNILSNT